MRAGILALVTLVALQSGCATLNKAECLTVDWRTVGFEDGVAGRSGDRIGEHREACAKYGVTPDLVAYQSGRDAGLPEYCQPENGFRLGSRGASYSGVCPADLGVAFSDAYASGRQLHTLQTRVSTAQSQLDSKRRELDRLEDEILRKAAIIVRDESTPEERAQAALDTKQMAERTGRLKAEIVQLERDRAYYERELADYRATITFGG